MTTKPSTSSSSTSNNTGATTPDFAALMQAAASMGGNVSGGAVFTRQEGNYVVQNMYQQILGRNATGNEYAKAMSIVMGQSQDTTGTARGEAVANFIQSTPEYQARQENNYLDAIYNEVAADVRKVRQ